MKYGIHKTQHYNRERQFDPSECRKGTYVTKPVGHEGTKVILCKKKHSNKQGVQSILKKRRR